MQSVENNVQVFVLCFRAFPALAGGHYVIELEAFVDGHACRDAQDLLRPLELVRDEPQLKRLSLGWKNWTFYGDYKTFNSCLILTTNCLRGHSRGGDKSNASTKAFGSQYGPIRSLRGRGDLHAVEVALFAIGSVAAAGLDFAAVLLVANGKVFLHRGGPADSAVASFLPLKKVDIFLHFQTLRVHQFS